VLPDEKILASINALIKDIKRDPFKGLGNPSPSNTRCRASGRAASLANTGWCIGVWEGRGAADRDRAVLVSLLRLPITTSPRPDVGLAAGPFLGTAGISSIGLMPTYATFAVLVVGLAMIRHFGAAL
jgi:hypothetical protein